MVKKRARALPDKRFGRKHTKVYILSIIRPWILKALPDKRFGVSGVLSLLYPYRYPSKSWQQITHSWQFGYRSRVNDLSIGVEAMAILSQNSTGWPDAVDRLQNLRFKSDSAKTDTITPASLKPAKTFISSASKFSGNITQKTIAFIAVWLYVICTLF